MSPVAVVLQIVGRVNGEREKELWRTLSNLRLRGGTHDFLLPSRTISSAVGSWQTMDQDDCAVSDLESWSRQTQLLERASPYIPKPLFEGYTARPDLLIRLAIKRSFAHPGPIFK